MAGEKDSYNDDGYGGDLYADLDLEDIDATQLEEELEDVPDLQPISDTPGPTPASGSATGGQVGNTTQKQGGGNGYEPQQQQYQPQQQQQQQYSFGAAPGSSLQGQGQQAYGQGGDAMDRIKPSDMPDEGKMFIGGLNWETSEEALREYMGKYGEIEACTIMRDPNGRSRGFAFLTYTHAASVNAVLAEVHHLDGKQIDPKRAIPRAEHERTAKVFVGGLAASVTSDSLKVFLTQFGPVMDATVMFDRETGRSKGFAFATFGNEESVGVAMAASGVELEGKPIEIKKAQPRGSGNLPNKFPSQRGGQAGAGGMGMMGSAGGMGGMGMGMGMGGGAGAVGGGAGGFDPSAMMMMYQNMMKNSGMGGMNMGGGIDPTAMAVMYQNMMKNMSGMNAPAINPNMARNGMGGMGMMGNMGGMGGMMGGMGNMGGMGGMGAMGGMGGMGAMGGMGGMAAGMGMGGYGGQGMGMNRGQAAPRSNVPNAPRGPAAMRAPGSEGGTTPNGGGGTGIAGPMAGGTGAQRYSTQGNARARPY